MSHRGPADRSGATQLSETFERYLQDKGKGRGGEGGNYRRNAARELGRFADWAAGDRGADDWTGIVPDDADRDPAFEDIDERVFREYARHLAGDRGLEQNTVQTYDRYLSAWCGWCVNEGYLEAHYAQRASAMAPLPDEGRKLVDRLRPLGYRGHPRPAGLRRRRLRVILCSIVSSSHNPYPASATTD